MSIIVRNIETNKLFILIGTSYSYFKDSRESLFGGALFPHEEEGTFDLIAVTNENGNIEWIERNKIQVVEIDGSRPRDILSRHISHTIDTDYTDEIEKCPGCGSQVEVDEKVCHSCGLTLILEEDND